MPRTRRSGSQETLFERSNLSCSQLLIWMGQRLNPDAPLYNMALAFEVSGPIDIPAFRQAHQRLIDSSDAMRTRIVDVDGVPQRRVIDDTSYDVAVIELSPVELGEWLKKRSRRAFVLDRCLFDSVVLKLSDERFVWFLNQHHLITDGWSVALSYRRLVEFYRRAHAGLDGSRNFPDYESYVTFEKAAREKPSHGRARLHWQEKITRPFEPTNFYGGSLLDRVPRTERLVCDLGEDRSERLKALAESPAVRAFTVDLSRFNLFVTALCAYLHRVGGNRDLAILTPAHNRPTPAFKNMIGLFIEIFPLYVSIDPGETFSSLLAKVRRETQSFLAHARPGTSDAIHSRSFDVLLNYIHSSFHDFDGYPMRSEWVHPGHGDPTHSLRLQVHDLDDTGSFALHFDLNCGVFGDAERHAVVRHFLAVLDAFLRDQETSIDQVDLLTESERRDHLESFNATATSWQAETILDAIEAHAALRPDDIAVACQSESMTYASLDEDANRLARQFASLGLAREDRIAICLPRSSELVVTLLAAIKARCSYVPIDLQTPPERVAWMLRDCEARLIVTTSALEARLPAGAGIPRLLLDETARDLGPHPDEELEARPLASDLAYVIYTSGSTGHPKGVMVEHGSLLNYVAWAREEYTGGGSVDLPLFTSVAFDLTVTSIFLPLASGGRVVVYPESSDSHDLSVLRVFEDDAVDIIKLTPSHLALVRQIEPKVKRLSTLIVGGEDLKVELARSILERFSGRVSVINEYGPTEATVGCMIHRFDPDRDLVGSVPIGKPAANTRIYLLDEARRPVATGLEGEIAVAGAGLARGYLGETDASARFVDDPFRPGDRMYLTGDRARRNARGELTFLGRRDRQVKVRGARIELSEIESKLERHPSVADCIVEVVDKVTVKPSPGGGRGFCSRCGLADSHPEGKLDAEGICAVCRAYESYRERAREYFGTMEDLRAIFDGARSSKTSSWDCLMLLSGGKDSTYALYQLVEMGLEVLVFSLDNGYISEGAKANMRRVVADLGVELVFGTTPAMNRIFADSLARYSNVCNGCFKTIYTMAVNLARERGIRHIVTGLSRGQIFETRLADFFSKGVFDFDAIDRTILEARKAYHRMDDAVGRCLDVEVFRNDEVFEEIRFVDFYRYNDTTLDEILTFLEDRAPWIRPEDTGRSTNCLINETGIFVHKKERGFHNYALPYSWDVRLGHKTKKAALEELDDDIDETTVQRTLREVGYACRETTEPRLAGYIVPRASMPTTGELREFLSERLPPYMVPSYFVPLDAIPLTSNGKVDRAALPRPDALEDRESGYSAPSNEMERKLAAIFAEVLSLDRVGAHDDFLELGGDSILGLQIVSRAAQEGLKLAPRQIFDHPTIAGLATVVMTGGDRQGSASEPLELSLTPMQEWFFEQGFDRSAKWCQLVRAQAKVRLEPGRLEDALSKLVRAHEALRLGFRWEGARWTPSIARQSAAGAPILMCENASSLEGELLERMKASTIRGAHEKLDLDGQAFRAILFQLGPERPDELVLMAHHLIVDADSWPTLLEDLEIFYRSADETPHGSMGWARWAAHCAALASTAEIAGELDYWRRSLVGIRALPSDGPGSASNARASSGTVTRHLDAATTRLLVSDARSRSVRAEDILLTALTLSVSAWTGHERVAVDLETHRRDGFAAGVDVGRTVGCLTSIYPVTLATPGPADPGAALRAIKEQLRGVPNGGHGFGLLRYLGSAPARAVLGKLPPPEILFSFQGELDPVRPGSMLFQPGGHLTVSRDDGERRSHAICVGAAVSDGTLAIEFGYSRQRFQAQTIDSLADSFLASLRSVLEACLSPAYSALTPSDFPEAGLTQAALDSVLEEFSE